MHDFTPRVRVLRAFQKNINRGVAWHPHRYKLLQLVLSGDPTPLFSSWQKPIQRLVARWDWAIGLLLIGSSYPYCPAPVTSIRLRHTVAIIDSSQSNAALQIRQQTATIGQSNTLRRLQRGYRRLLLINSNRSIRFSLINSAHVASRVRHVSIISVID